jgi:DNA invertase Pin-like site-specific DNA recombinase
MTPASNTPAVLYLRVSSAAQGESGLGLEAQEAACRRECERRGWVVHDVVTEIQSGAKDVRTGFNQACEAAKSISGVVVAAEASRFSRGSTTHVLSLYERAARDGYSLYALDLPEIDITSPSGELMLTLLAAINRFERRMIAQRTSRALRAKAARGEPVGRPKSIPQALVDQVRSLRADGLSYRKIAAALNEQGVTTHTGGSWKHEYVYGIVKRYGLQDATKNGEG